MVSMSVCSFHMSACLSACLSVREHTSETIIRLQFFVHANVAMAPFASGGVFICYVLPGLWTTTCLLHIMDRIGDARRGATQQAAARV